MKNGGYSGELVGDWELLAHSSSSMSFFGLKCATVDLRGTLGRHSIRDLAIGNSGVNNDVSNG